MYSKEGRIDCSPQLEQWGDSFKNGHWLDSVHELQDVE